MAKAIKAPKFHREATEETYDLLNDMIRKHHHYFEDTSFLILMKHGGWKSKGKEQFGKIKVLGEDLRSTWDKDAILYLNADMWVKMSEPQQRYVLDNALFALDTKSDKDGNTLEAVDGRPLLKTVPPDIEAFVEVIKRHGTTTQDVKRLAAAIKEVNPDQVTIEDVIGAGGKQQGGEDPKPPGNGLQVKRNADGSIDLDDPNQTKLEDYEGEGQSGEGGPTIPDDDLPF
ncbi:putative metallopeptidase [Paenibacillus sp. FSL R7-0331]|uniref:putative metallopeptidase n=1 Tax=Paenibacillus sp. FSL R7-0331 TaxID=1536773 RepID=UPI0004F6EBCB|nr:putative metallopeptidase [Paenibacillus sp. FSL R7-0331]AIQ54524.1 hypothetical protein R70331_25375 [Paenibacillus sp. FSL R7-0331]